VVDAHPVTETGILDQRLEAGMHADPVAIDPRTPLASGADEDVALIYALGRGDRHRVGSTSQRSGKYRVAETHLNLTIPPSAAPTALHGAWPHDEALHER
jgi:hypothetical protein